MVETQEAGRLTRPCKFYLAYRNGESDPISPTIEILSPLENELAVLQSTQNLAYNHSHDLTTRRVKDKQRIREQIS